MILLSNPTDSLEVVLASSVASTQWSLYAAYADITSTTFSPSAVHGLSDNTNAATLLAGPPASTQRQVKYLSAYNSDTQSSLITLRLNSNSTLRTLCSVSLASGFKLEYVDGRGFQVLSPTGGRAIYPGSVSATISGTVRAEQSGTWSVTANAGTNLNTSALALESGGNLAAATASLSVLDDWDESDRCKANLIVGQAGIAGGSGVDGATVPRVTLATNVGLPAGTNAIGRLYSNPGVIIGSVERATAPMVSGGISIVDSSSGSHNPPTTNSYLVASTSGYDFCVLYFSGTYIAAIAYEGTVDGTNWFSVQGRREIFDRWESASGTQTNVSRHIWIPTNGATYIRVRCTTYTSGTMSVILSPTNVGTAALMTLLGGGDCGSGIADIGNPVKIGGVAKTSEQTAVSTGQRVNAFFDVTGKQIIQLYSNPENFVQGKTAAMTGTGDTQVIASAGASTRNYITNVTITNSHATVGTEVVIKDGTTELFRVWVSGIDKSANTVVVSFPTPLRGSAATALNAANVTTGSNTYVSASGWKGV